MMLSDERCLDIATRFINLQRAAGCDLGLRPDCVIGATLAASRWVEQALSSYFEALPSEFRDRASGEQKGELLIEIIEASMIDVE